MSSTLAVKHRRAAAAPAEVVVKNRVLCQITKAADGWMASMAIYGSPLRFLPLSLSEVRVHELLRLCGAEQTHVVDQGMIIEMMDSHLTLDAIRQFGFACH